MRFLVMGLLALSLSACATGYKKMGDGGTVMGYDETPLSKGQYRVSYRGMNGQAPTEVYAWFLRRGAELAKQDAAPFFKVTDGHQTSETVNTFGGMVFMPHFTGTVILLSKEEQGAVNTDEVLSRYASTPKQVQAKSKSESGFQYSSGSPVK